MCRRGVLRVAQHWPDYRLRTPGHHRYAVLLGLAGETGLSAVWRRGDQSRVRSLVRSQRARSTTYGKCVQSLLLDCIGCALGWHAAVPGGSGIAYLAARATSMLERDQPYLLL